MKIHKNLYASNLTYFVSMKQSGRYYYGLMLIKIQGKWIIRRVNYTASDVRSDMFPVVGEIDLYKIIEDAVLGAVKE